MSLGPTDAWEYEVDVTICGDAPLLNGAPPLLHLTPQDLLPPGWELVARTLRREGGQPVLITTRRRLREDRKAAT